VDLEVEVLDDGRVAEPLRYVVEVHGWHL
jgi:hypothetical protein